MQDDNSKSYLTQSPQRRDPTSSIMVSQRSLRLERAMANGREMILTHMVVWNVKEVQAPAEPVPVRHTEVLFNRDMQDES